MLVAARGLIRADFRESWTKDKILGPPFEAGMETIFLSHLTGEYKSISGGMEGRPDCAARYCSVEEQVALSPALDDVLSRIDHGPTDSKSTNNTISETASRLLTHFCSH